MNTQKMAIALISAVVVALLVSTLILTIGVSVSINHAAKDLEPEKEEPPSYTAEFIKTMDMHSGTILIDGGTSMSYLVTDNISQNDGMLKIYRPSEGRTYYIPIDHIVRIQV